MIIPARINLYVSSKIKVENNQPENMELTADLKIWYHQVSPQKWMPPQSLPCRLCQVSVPVSTSSFHIIVFITFYYNHIKGLLLPLDQAPISKRVLCTLFTAELSTPRQWLAGSNCSEILWNGWLFKNWQISIKYSTSCENVRHVNTSFPMSKGRLLV